MRSGNKVIGDLFEKYHKPLILYCINKGLTETEAEDVVSEAFCRFWEKYDILKDLDPNQRKKWLYSAVTNIFHDEVRYKNKNLSDSDSEEIENIPNDGNELDSLIEKHAYEQMKSRFEKELTESEKQAFLVTIDLSEGLTYKELQEKYGIPIPTLKTKTKRLRDKSHDILKRIFKKQ